MKTSMRHRGIMAVVVGLLLTMTLSLVGCTGTRAYVAHDYEFGPGEGTIEYRVGDGHHYRYKKPKHKKVKHKKPKYKKHKQKKPKKHDRHNRHRDHDDDDD